MEISNETRSLHLIVVATTSSFSSFCWLSFHHRHRHPRVQERRHLQCLLVHIRILCLYSPLDTCRILSSPPVEILLKSPSLRLFSKLPTVHDRVVLEIV